MPASNFIALGKTIQLSRNIPGLLCLLFVCSVCAAQTPVADSTTSVSGRVTISGKPAVGISVVARLLDSSIENRTVAKAVTDDDGNYHLTGLPTARLVIVPIAKAYVVAGNGTYSQPGQTVNIAPNEAIVKIDFTLVRGGVITGRITDLDGRPIIAEVVNLSAVSDSAKNPAISFFQQGRNLTDDRGVYRIYGLAPGSYTVSVGRAQSSGSHTNFYGTGGSQYTITFYPGVADSSKATALEIGEASEVVNIDITPGKVARGFSVSGRVVDAETSQPVANAFIAYASVSGENQRLSGMNFTGSQSDRDGKFRLEGIDPGHYAAFTMAIGKDNSSYSDPAPFFISSGDVSGIEIKVRRGATIEGFAVIENNADPAAAALLQSVSLYAYVFDQSHISAPSFSRAKINPDGSFQFTGLAPGKASIQVAGFPDAPRGLELIRMEHQGQTQASGIDVTAGARVSGVRIVFSYGTGKIRGELKIGDGTWPEGLNVMLNLRSVGGSAQPYSRALVVDSRGRFVADNLPPGMYELRLLSNADVPMFEPVIQTVTVANGIEVPVTIVVQITAP